jgi:hypothetical protein
MSLISASFLHSLDRGEETKEASKSAGIAVRQRLLAGGTRIRFARRTLCLSG